MNKHKLFNNKKCPRCNLLIVGYPALSRTDNNTQICPKCGVLEAIQFYFKSVGDLSDK